MDGHAPETEPQGVLRSRGLQFPRNFDILSPRVRRALRSDSYERKESDAALRMVQDGDTVLELGGGIGYMSTLLSVKRKLARIVTYEANPALIPYIAQVHAANGVENADVRNALLAPEPGAPLPFYVRKNFLGSSMDYDSDPDTIEDTVEIDQHGIAPTLDEVKPDVLVCDIEGAEATLLPAGDWSGLRCAIIELHPQWIGQAGVQAVFDAMHKAGLTYFPKPSEAKVVAFRKGW